MSISGLLIDSDVVAECLNAWRAHPIFRRDFVTLTEGPAQMSAEAVERALTLHVPRMALEAADGAPSVAVAIERFIAAAVWLDEMQEQYS